MPTKTKPIIVGNWKMYKTVPEALQFVESLKDQLIGREKQILLAVPFTMIREVSLKAKGFLQVGAQNMNDASEGAFTGEVSARMLLDAGAQFVILGHSERRQHYKESNEFINKKVKRALTDGLQVILCIGETFEEHESGQTVSVLEAQLLGSLQDVRSEDFKNILIAYEPIWAVGSGKPARPVDVVDENKAIREIVANQWGKKVGEDLKILYGGSVNATNAKDFFNEPDIDGLLIGSASLNVDDFGKIISET